jgi:hypothetical protein
VRDLAELLDKMRAAGVIAEYALFGARSLESLQKEVFG